MESEGKSNNQGLDKAIVQLQVWAQSQGVSAPSCTKIANLCKKSFLLSQPVPRNWSRREEYLKEEHCQYLWYRNIAKILGWRERRRFPDFVREILNEYIFPSPNTDYHEVACTGQGDSSRANHADSRVHSRAKFSTPAFFGEEGGRRHARDQTLPRPNARHLALVIVSMHCY